MRRGGLRAGSFLTKLHRALAAAAVREASERVPEFAGLMEEDREAFCRIYDHAERLAFAAIRSRFPAAVPPQERPAALEIGRNAAENVIDAAMERRMGGRFWSGG